MIDTAPANAEPRPGRGNLLRDHVIVLAAAAALAITLRYALSLSDPFVLKVLAALGAGGGLSLLLAGKHLPAGRFGAANRVTLFRGGLVAVLLGLVAEPAGAWAAVAIGAAALALDGVDGWLARRLRSETAYGARFDMETDALLLLVLAALVLQSGKAGPWVLLAGLMRYIFVGAARIWPRLGRPLAPSLRRKSAFVFQAVLLVACLAPVVSAPVGRVLALAGLAGLTASFAIDVARLAAAGAPVAGTRA